MRKTSSSIVALLVLFRITAVHADEDSFTQLQGPSSASYWWDGGMLPFFYLPVAASVGYRKYLEPPDEPMMFSKMEGGAIYAGGQYPVAMLYADAAIVGGAIVLGGDESRWYHIKGYAQGLAMTSMLTAISKSTFGRHRPMYDLDAEAENTSDVRKSFFSGHSSMTLATASYLALYARGHLFNRWRKPGTLPWWEVASYAALAVGAVAIPYSQYALHRHHASDVITGSVVGASMGTLFYFYQEHRFRNAEGKRRTDLKIVPNPGIGGITVMGQF